MTQTKPKNITGLTKEAESKRTRAVIEAVKKSRANAQNLHVYIADGNIKTGDIPSVSLLPRMDCGNCSLCAKMCYDWRNDLCYQGCLERRADNSVLYATYPERYFNEIRAYLSWYRPRAFRWHIGGDIKDEYYLEQMIAIANEFPDTQFLAFTKMFYLINNHVRAHMGIFIPDNLHIIFSSWRGMNMDNPFNFPTSHPIFLDGTDAPDGTRLCTGNCTECAKTNTFCWNLKRGESIGFYCH